ncbi:MAG: type II toxin-antitoxin system PemK/MazF family toxin [Clostridia bacterium]|nr:type II toxin-antitoxin system PemK/MazF family toxin [Clostridia bacterium]
MPNIDLQETQDELQWLDKKLEIKARRLASGQSIMVRRGEVYGCDFGYNIGVELRGYHPCVIVENDATSATRWSVCVAPITHASQRQHMPASLVPITRQAGADGKTIIEGYADVAGIRAVSKARLTKRITRLLPSDMLEIDKALASITDLYEHYKRMSAKYDAAKKRGDAKEEKAKKLRQLLIEAEKILTGDADDDLRQRIAEALKL